MDCPSISKNKISKRKQPVSCFVPMCPSNSQKFPNKQFLTVPKDPEIRKKWIDAATMDPRYAPAPKFVVRCCEDHFDMENDIENSLKYRFVGSRPVLKTGVIPHIFECQQRMEPGKPGTTPNTNITIGQKGKFDSDNFDKILLNGIKRRLIENVSTGKEHHRHRDTTLLQQRIQPKLLNCDKCVQTFACDNSFKEHYRRDHMAELLEHIICLKQLPMKHYLRKHTRHGGTLEYECVVCKKTYKFKKCFRRHFKKYHQSETKELQAADGQRDDRVTSAPANDNNMDADQGVSVKAEPEDTDLDIGPTVLQHMDSYYKTNQFKQNTSVVCEAESTFASNNHHSSLQGKEDIIEVDCGVGKERHHHKDAKQQHIQPKLISCDKCVETFTSDNSFMEHYRREHLIKPLEQSMRMKQFPMKHYLRNRISHDGTLKYECVVCKKIYKIKKCLRRHVKQYHQPKIKDTENITCICDYCQKRYTNKINVKRHIMRMHTKRPYKCHKCKRSFISEEYLKAHRATAHPVNRKKCDICDIAMTVRHFKKHMSTMHSDKEFQCNICGDILISQANFHCHLKNVHLNQPVDGECRLYACDYCQKLFTSKTGIERHIVFLHTSKSYKCDKCGKSYVCEEYLKAHELSVHATHMEMCNICGKLLRPHSLKLHMFKVHIGGKYPCNICGETMLSERCLNYHKNDFHCDQPAETLNNCHYCEKSYCSKHSLKYHMITCHGSRDHRCAECSVDCKDEHCVQNHLKSQHFKRDHKESSQQSTSNISEKGNYESTHHTVDKPIILGDTSSQQYEVIDVKEEPIDEMLDVGPVMFQHMDFNYRPFKEELLTN